MDTTGNRRGWVRSLHSIRLPCCPSLEKSHGLVRGSMYRSGYIFLELQGKPDVVEVIHTLHLDLKGNAPSWLQVQAMRRRIRDIAAINQYFQLQRVLQGHLIGDLELPLKKDVVQCQLCALNFGMFHRRWQCRKCGLKICTNCSEHFQVNYAGTGAKKVRICSQCVDTGKRSRRLFPVGFSKRKYLTEDFVLQMCREKDYTQSTRSLRLARVNSSPAIPTRRMVSSRYSHGIYHHDQNGNDTQYFPRNTTTATANAGSGIAHSLYRSDEHLQQHEINEILESKRLQNDFEMKQRDRNAKMEPFENRQAGSLYRNAGRQNKNVSFLSSEFTTSAPSNVIIGSESTPLAKSTTSPCTSRGRADSTGVASFQNIGKKSFFSRYDFQDEHFRDVEDVEDVFASMQSIKTDKLRGDGEIREMLSGSKGFDVISSPSMMPYLGTNYLDEDHCGALQEAKARNRFSQSASFTPSSLDTDDHNVHSGRNIIDTLYESNRTIPSRKVAYKKRSCDEDTANDAARVAAQAFALKEIEDAAIGMAFAAMKLFEKENHGELQVPTGTRQAALCKMTDMYRDKIQREVSSSQSKASSRPSQFSCDTTQESKNDSDHSWSEAQDRLDLSQLDSRTTHVHQHSRMRSHTRPMRTGSNNFGIQWHDASSSRKCISDVESSGSHMTAFELQEWVPTTLSTATKSDYEMQADYELYTSHDDSLIDLQDSNENSCISDRRCVNEKRPLDMSSDTEQKITFSLANEQRIRRKTNQPRFSATFIASSNALKEKKTFSHSRIPGESISQEELDKLRESLLQLMSECMSE